MSPDEDRMRPGDTMSEPDSTPRETTTREEEPPGNADTTGQAPAADDVTRSGSAGEQRLSLPPHPRPRLEHPPGERYIGGAGAGDSMVRAAGGADSAERRATGRTSEPSGSQVGAVALGSLAAAAGVVVIIFLAGVMSVTLGLVAVAAAGAWLVGLAVRTGGGTRVSQARRARLTIGLTLGMLVAASIGTWLYALSEGGVLPILDYLLTVYGAVVPLEFLVGLVVAWWTSRQLRTDRPNRAPRGSPLG